MMTDLNIEQVLEKVEKTERLKKIVYCLYNDKPYILSDMKLLDSKNREIAYYIIHFVYPENIFGDVDRFK
jgi:hypothetical protein